MWIYARENQSEIEKQKYKVLRFLQVASNKRNKMTKALIFTYILETNYSYANHFLWDSLSAAFNIEIIFGSVQSK